MRAKYFTFDQPVLQFEIIFHNNSHLINFIQINTLNVTANISAGSPNSQKYFAILNNHLNTTML